MESPVAQDRPGLGASITGTWLLPALVDFDKDGKTEVIATMGDTNSVVLWRYDATEPSKAKILRAPFKAHVDPGGAWGWSFGMGPITAGDFDGDGTPDAGYVGFRGYVVLDGKKLMDTTLPSTLAVATATRSSQVSSVLFTGTPTTWACRNG